MRVPLGHRSSAALAALSLAGVLVLTGCGSAARDTAGVSSDKAAPAPREAAAEGNAGAAAAAPAAPSAAPGAADKNGQQPALVRPNVIRTAVLAIESADPQKTLTAARTAADAAGGYVSNESTRRDEDGRMTSSLTLRVPGDRYDGVLGSLEGGGKLLHRKVDAQDVTEKVADIGSRVSTQQASVARVREMMDKASALSEVVMLESELTRRQSDLESLLAQQAALKDQTSMGTISLSVTEPAAKPGAEKEKEKEPAFTDALGGGWDVFTTIVRYLALALGALLPFAVTAALGLLGYRLYRRLRPAAPKPAPATERVPVPAARPADSDTGADVRE